MRSLKIFKDKKGFTAIELLVVIAIFALLGTVGALIGFDAIGRSSVHSERDLLVTLLIGVRARALANVDELPQGVHVDTNNYVLFEGTTYNSTDPKNRIVDRNTSVSVPSGTDIIFDQLSANVAAPVNIALVQDNMTDTVDVNSEGRIDW